MFVDISQDSEWAGADGMHPIFVGKKQTQTGSGRSPDHRISDFMGSHMGAVQAEEKGRDLERTWFPRDVAVVGAGRHHRAVG